MNEPKQKKTVINLYGAYNDELARMHELVKLQMTLIAQQPVVHGHSYGSINHGYSNHHGVTLETFYTRMVELQNVLVEALKGHDPLIQEKVAELALTGDKDEIPF